MIGPYSRELFRFEIIKASITKATNALQIIMKLNFVIPFADLAVIRETMLKELPDVNGISFDFIYEDMCLTDSEIIGLYIPHMIQDVNGDYKHLTNTIFAQDYSYSPEGKRLVIKALGDEAVSKLNKDVALPFSRLFYEKFRLTVDIVFENHAAEYSQKTKEAHTEAEAEYKAMDNAESSHGRAAATSKKTIKAPLAVGRLLGKPMSEEPIPIKNIAIHSGTVVVEGKVFAKNNRSVKNNKKMATLFISDGSGSACVKLFLSEDKWQELDVCIGIGDRVKIRGHVDYDNYEGALVIMGKDIEKKRMALRCDEAPQKRVELHAHTKMSAMDGLIDTRELIGLAASWGHKAIAITDHGVAQAFPDAMEAARALKGKIKAIYGIEGYIFEDESGTGAYPAHLTTESTFIVFDLETTGLSALKDEIIEIGAVRVSGKKITDRFHALIRPALGYIPSHITELTGITYEMVKNAPSIDQIFPQFLAFIQDLPLVAHNADFDLSFIREEARKRNIEIGNPVLDTLYLARLLLKDLKRHKLNIVADALSVDMTHHHRADDDARVTAEILIRLFEKLEAQGIHYINDISLAAGKAIDYKIKETNHIIILVKNEIGLKNLYQLISKSHMDYFYKKPRIPKSVLRAFREGLILGSACQAGEVYQSILQNKSEKEINDLVSFYDYLEIQPLVNNEFLIQDGRVSSQEALMANNRRIIGLAEAHGKLAVATCDAHYLDPSEALYRKILMSGQGYKDIEGDEGLYLRTTEEMLAEFAYLGPEMAHKVVIENTNAIADAIDWIQPIPDGTFPPKIQGAEESLRTLCWATAHSIYGNPLPEIVEQRLTRELNSIIDHGYAVMYVVAQMLVEKSMRDGYLVGSRGSVGSSFAATMSGITEVNPLPAHYICPSCKHSDFSNSGGFDCGVDMPEEKCPVCGTSYRKEGFSIPFEVFLGFEGDKEPDIDLNFAGEYQAVAHKYTEEIFGKSNVYRAGTIGTIASKTAYGFVMKYFEQGGETASKWEIDRLTQCCTGVKRTTGQHPGGIMIVPQDKDIYDFCPVQFPANDATSGIITTHFDYHSISGRLLKLDILGHDVPTMIKMLQDLTGVDPLKVPLRDQRVNSIFNGIEGINIGIRNYRYNHGSFGIPEFGTKFVRQMLDATSPSSFSDLIRISGLSHGTNVWINNAQELILGGTAVLQDVISTRDDIMNYLIQKGVPNKTAFKIMESVRKGKGITEEEAKEMQRFHVPEWYVESCRRIEYMFPKAHAVAYVMMSYRIAYYKVYYPLEFYAVIFSMRISEFDSETILKGIHAVEKQIVLIEQLGKSATKKQEDELIVLELAYEMYARGFSFKSARIGVSDARYFKVSDGQLLLPIMALSGLGENAALAIEKEFAKGIFLSVDDLKSRTRINKTAVLALKTHGMLTDLPESDQLTLW
jgi:DNA polymerase-3 subunit alpha (Gram-positive type)